MTCPKNISNIYNTNYHTHAEWWYDSKQEVIAAEKQQEASQRLTLEADRLIHQTKDTIIKNKLEIDHQSKVKVKDIVFKCEEIERKKYDLSEEMELLLIYQTRIENANKSLVGNSLDIIAECLRVRKCRINIDLVFDDVEKELLRERELIYGINTQLEDLLDKVVLQIRKLRSYIYRLDLDLNDKKKTLDIEAHNVNLNENSIEISIIDDDNIFKPATISNMEWQHFTSEIMSEANKVLVEGRPIRAFFDKTLSKMIDDLVNQSNAVDQAIRLRVEEYREVIEKLKKQRHETIEKMEEVQTTIEQLKSGIDDKAAYLALAHTRLFNRTRREGIELCRDELEVKLFDEVTELEQNVQNLQRMKAESLVCLRHLKQSTVRINLALDAKENSLHIDNVLCVEQRKYINYHAF